MSKRPLPGRLKGLGHRNWVLRRGELRTLHRTHYRNICLPWSGGKVGIGWIRKFHYTPLVLDLGTERTMGMFSPEASENQERIQYRGQP